MRFRTKLIIFASVWLGADDLEEYIAVFGKSLTGPNMSTGAVDVLDKAMFQVVRFNLGR